MLLSDSLTDMPDSCLKDINNLLFRFKKGAVKMSKKSVKSL